MIDLTQFENHTPGPWETGVNNPLYVTIPSIKAGMVIAEVYRPTGDCAGEANARLIAAAPELLAEVKALRERVAELEDGLRQIAIWKQEDQDNHETCILQWRGCVAIARELLKAEARNDD